MSIQWNETNREFHLRNSFMSYVLAILSDGGIGAAHFGSPLAEEASYGRLIRFESRAASLHQEGLPVEFCPDYAPREYPTSYRGDFRASALEAFAEDGAPLALDLVYAGHLLRQGKPPVSSLPSTYTEDAAEAETLTIYLRDSASGVEVDLHYSLFRDFPAIARRATIRNVGARAIRISRALSAAAELPDADWDLIQFSGAWARERRETRRHLAPGSQYVSSSRGQSSHQQNPAIILSRPDVTETAGEAYGCALVYSGNFIAGADVGSHENARVLIGIDPTSFSWKLEGGVSFETPEAVFAYTSTGLATLSHTFHDLFGRHLARGPWRDRPRPILLNNWEATYFDFDEAKLLSIAESAKALGVELFVLDDGWFGERNDDTSSLGDWDVNTKKLPEGIPGLARKIEDLGLRFGLWVEPEMVSPKSRLFSEHPDWAVGPMGGRRTLGRNQYVLDLSRSEVVEYLYGVLSRLLRTAPISYVKWDMNRNLSDPVSAALPGDRQGEFFHRYVLGLYELYGRLTEDFPEVLFESCAAGGGRFDAGMLAFAPQAWTSDDSDAIERLSIQWGSSFFYPTSSIGAHVSAVPNHQVGRITPLGTRAAVAFYGAFGYELDPTRLSSEERTAIADQMTFYKQWREVFQFGVFHRLRGRDDADGNEVSWMTVSKDGRRAAVLRVQVLARPNPPFGRLRLRGLEPSLRYRVSVRPSTPVNGEASIRYNAGLHGGDELMAVGLLLGGDGLAGIPRGDFASWLFTLEAEERPST